MFQVLVRYFGDRCGSFFVEEPISKYSLLLQKIKSVIPCFLQLQDEQMRIAYYDVQSGCFINISPEDQLHLLEAFKNVVPSGHDRYNRIDLKVWESDSPSFLRKAVPALDGGNANKRDIVNNCVYDSASTEELPKAKTPKRLDFSANVHAADVVDWKENKKEEISNKLQWLEDRKIALQTHIRELEIPVEEPMRIGTYRTICGNCHIRGHRADGNRNNDACNDKALFTALLEQQENVMSELKNNSAACVSTVNTITVAVSPVQPRNVKRKRLREKNYSCNVSSDSSSSDSSPERKPCKKSKRKARKTQKRRKKSQAKSSRKKRRRRRSTSSDSESDSVSSNESLYEHKSHKEETKGKLCDPENTVNISNTQYSQVQRQREQCSLTELATIAVAINKGKGEYF